MFTQKGRAVGFRLKGHAEQGAYGEDIVCAGISAITQTAVLGVTEVLKLEAEATLQEGNASCILKGNVSAEEAEKASVVFKTMAAGLLSLKQAYPTALNLLYREV